MKVKTIVKGSIKITTAVGVSILGTSTLGIISPATLNIAQKVCVSVAGSVVNSMILDKCWDYTDELFNQIAPDDITEE